MNLTISLEEPLAKELQRQAFARDLSPEAAASELLSDALSRIADQEAWTASSRRRAELIAKNRNPGLTGEERDELDRLQSDVDRRLAPIDRRLLVVAEEFRQLAERLPDATAP